MKSLLIAGYGDIARRAMPALGSHFEVRVLSRSNGMNLDRPETLAALQLADAVLHCAPPQQTGESDSRTANLLKAFESRRILPSRLVYISTSGVYGDCGGALVDEARAVNPQSQRAQRRVDAEQQLARWCTRHRVALVVLRAPGIYAADRLPLERLRAGTPTLRDQDDVYTSHIHAEDLAGICARALEDDAPAGVYNAADDTQLKMGEWFDLLADRAGLPRPPRIARSEAAERLPPGLLSFMNESRRLDNTRLKRILGIRLCYPTVRQGLELQSLKHERPAGIDQPA
ncbi:MAG: SDR family NAD(P)-dependent oxidoreductase [Betaproteobacteria bacterium]|nr:SDR family NAD(P)-dependent oxidoreductase [Betaproteobacteria bacterium]MSQ87783.1 SDR family NAD(P)-dependent oxidoreductase [Betaproteobacteria bacterium]